MSVVLIIIQRIKNVQKIILLNNICIHLFSQQLCHLVKGQGVVGFNVPVSLRFQVFIFKARASCGFRILIVVIVTHCVVTKDKQMPTRASGCRQFESSWPSTSFIDSFLPFFNSGKRHNNQHPENPHNTKSTASRHTKHI